MPVASKDCFFTFDIRYFVKTYSLLWPRYACGRKITTTLWQLPHQHLFLCQISTIFSVAWYVCHLCVLSHLCPLLKPMDRFGFILAGTLMQFKEWGRGGLGLNPQPKHAIAPHCVTHLFERQTDLTPMDLWIRPKEVAEFLNV